MAAYNGTARRPARTVYVLDVSGSMAGERLDALRQALDTLTSGTLLADEQITLIPFSSSPGTPATFDLSAAQPQRARVRIRAFAETLTARARPPSMTRWPRPTG
ncbi:VWA domain-containing protein [Catellatospora sp. NPDC049609]|uniref:VWA domain-containing protein n=1 Tax=Catellatospora sp. NPDC049609 TaxID=3155505 RepID=UPI00342DF7BA